ncbi:hypothetical protein HK100_007984, partial [Physocladia obscura]
MRLQFKLRESVFSAIQTQSSDPAAIDRELTDYIADVIWNSNGYNIASEDSISASIVNEIHGDLMSFGISGNIAESNRITDAILEKWQQKNLEHENEEIKTSGANESDESSDAEYLEPGACEICYRVKKLSFHHLIPRMTHKRVVGKGLFTKNECRTRGIKICSKCHRMLHKTWTHMELALERNTLDKIMESE